MKFRLEIDCDNAAFGDTERQRDEEIRRIMRRVMYELNDANEGLMIDINGNRVGEWKVEGE